MTEEAAPLSISVCMPRFLWRFAPPLLAYLVVQALLLASVRPHAERWHAAPWNRYDVMHYLSIAERGYEAFPCVWRDQPALCGNAGWFPGYPFLVRATLWTGIKPLHAALLVTALTRLAFLVLAWSMLSAMRPRMSPLLTLLLVALWPGAIYQHAPFPLALFSMCALGALLSIRSERWWLAAACGAAAAYVYSTGFLMGPVLAVSVILVHRRWRAAFLVGVAPTLGFLAALATQWMYLRRWDAFFLVQAKYGHHLQNPMRALRTYMFPPEWTGTPLWLALQTFLVLVLVGYLVCLAARTGWQLEDRPRVVYAVTYWLFALAMGPTVSPYRPVALLCASAPILRHAPRWLQIVLLAALTLLDYKVGLRYFRGEII